MGTWGPGSFENDDAMDWVGELCEWDSFESVHEAMEDVNETNEDDEIEAPECACALAAAEVVAASLGVPSRKLPTDLANWMKDHHLKVSALLRRRTLAAIDRIKTRSELKELWDESKSGKKWRAVVDDLETRLAKTEVENAATKKNAKKTVKKKSSGKSARRPRAKFGDILEIKSKAGLNYAIFTHKSSRMGHVIQIFDRTFKKRPIDLAELHKLPIRFATLTHVPILATTKPVSIVGNFGLPKHLQPFPLFRSGITDPETRKVAIWWFWDGEKSWRVGKITKKQRKMPIKSIPSLGCLLDWLQTGWRPETDDE